MSQRRRPNRRLLGALLVAAASTLVVVVAQPRASAAGTTVTFAAVADGTADSSRSGSYPDPKELAADASPAKVAYVRFAPTGLPASHGRAVLRLHVRDRSWAASTSVGQIAAVATTTWSEATLTYATRPTVGAVVAAGSGAAARNTWVEFDVTSQVHGDDVVSLAIATTSGKGVYYDSRETGALGPQLVVSSSTTAPPPPPAPTTTTTAPPPPPPSGPTTIVLPAVADATVDASAPGTNAGSVSSLVAGAGPERAAYVRFDLSSVTGTISAARLRLHSSTTADAGSGAGGTVRGTSATWGEASITWANRPGLGSELWKLGMVGANRWVDMDVAWALRPGQPFAAAVTSTSTDLVRYDARESGANAPQLVVTYQGTTPPPPTPPPPPGTATVLAAGDIAGCTWDGDEATAKLLDANPDATVAALGDVVYGTSSATDFANCYGPTWGRHKARTRPTIGNHETTNDRGNPYWDYFGAAAGDRGQGWYSYDLGSSWHVVVLNANCWYVGGCDPASPQGRWLHADLAANARPCTLAYWHEPLFSSAQGSPETKPLWDALSVAGAELVLNGHQHGYERFAPQRPDGTRDDARGIREFVVGTGGSPYSYNFPSVLANSEVRNGDTHGVLKLILGSSSYSWNFLPVAGKTFTDSGATACH